MRPPPKQTMSRPSLRLSSGIPASSGRRVIVALFQSTCCRLYKRTSLGRAFMNCAIGLSERDQPREKSA